MSLDPGLPPITFADCFQAAHLLPALPYKIHFPPRQSNANREENRLQQACMKKCIPREYREADLNKGEGVCIDRCAAKFFDVQLKVSELLQAEAAAKGGATGGGFGMGGM